MGDRFLVSIKRTCLLEVTSLVHEVGNKIISSHSNLATLLPDRGPRMKEGSYPNLGFAMCLSNLREFTEQHLGLPSPWLRTHSQGQLGSL